jgi:hypothetical protein
MMRAGAWAPSQLDAGHVPSRSAISADDRGTRRTTHRSLRSQNPTPTTNPTSNTRETPP